MNSLQLMMAMKKILLAFLAINISLLFSWYSFAQDILWNTTPTKGFVFQITNKEAQKLLTISSPDTIFNGLLHTLIDTFNVEKGWISRPTKGHFILAKIIGNKLHCEYTSVFPYQVFLLKEYDALALQVLDLNGNVRADAKVKFKLKRLRIDSESKTYRVENDWFHGDNRIVTIELDGFRSVFNIQKHDVPSWYNNGYDEDKGPSFYSYMVTDKNKYKPNERVRFKSYALSQTRSPLHKDLEVWLIAERKSMKVGEVKPHRPGSYAGEVHLHDSLKLTLDESFNLQLRERSGRMVSSCNFKYEDYELNGNKLEVQLATDTQFHPANNELTITATDINGLVLKDAKASILVRTQMIRETFQPLVILPDTLLFTEIDLDPNGVTMFDIPSAMFQKTNTAYEVNVTVRNSQNQLMERTLNATHYYSQYELTTQFSNDSIIYKMLYNNVPMKEVPMKLMYNGEVSQKEVCLPYKEILNPVISTIRLQGDLLSREIFLSNLIPHLELNGGIKSDSFNIVLDNPQKLAVSWYVYQGSMLIKKGFGNELEYKSDIVDRTATFYVELLYSFGGEEHIKRKEYEFKEDFLNVSLDVPKRVYPGQQVEATIQVTDQHGNPVNGVDLTAMAVTAKLNYTLPDLPYYGSSSTPRWDKAHYNKKDINKRSAILDLDYKKWEKIAGLDTLKYYQFTYPGPTHFRYSFNVDDSTQFAPYVMQGGSAKEIYVIEVDRKPVYYSWADQPKKYSFYVSPVESHEVSLRLFDRVLILDSVSFEVGKKTILSIDLDHLTEDITVLKFFTPVAKKRRNKESLYPTFTQTEINRHTQYLSSFKNAKGNAYLEFGKEFTPLFSVQFPTHSEAIIVGPINPGKQTYTNYYGSKTTYHHTGGYTYAFEDNIVYKLNATKLLPERLYNNKFNPMGNINDKVMTNRIFLTQLPTPELKWHTRVIDVVDHASRIRVLLPSEKEASGIAAFLFENFNSKIIVSPCQYMSQSKFYTMPRGCYNAIVIYNSGKYLKMDSVLLKSYSNLVIDLNHFELHPADSLSATWLQASTNNCYNSNSTSITSKSIELKNSRAVIGNVRGTIYDDANMPLPGATVVVKGTANGAVTDMDGHFALDITTGITTLVVSFIGYMPKEIEIQPSSNILIYMVPDLQRLTEIVVIGYGTATKQSVCSSVSMLSGRTAGVTITNLNNEKVDVSESKQQEEITREAEQQLYQELLTLNSIRSNFSDVGFWEPRLYTDKHGQSKFKITFPDDITRWDATVYAMNRHLQTGTIRKSIKSYKPLMAELHVPQFLTRGDSAFFLGKVLNYTQDKNIAGKVKWTGAQTDFEKDITFTNFSLDKLPVNAMSADSITTRYLFTRDDGYVDGEERTVPVVEQGIIRADGTLSFLKNKDSVHVIAADREQVTIEILNSQLDIYSGEVKYLVDYKYACNEQLASKLIGFVNHRMLMKYEGKPFTYDKDINKIIARLLKNQNQEFLWSWWDVSSSTSYWMSAHILRALKLAQEAGYKVDLNIENMARKAEYKFDFLHHYDLSDADVLHALAVWDAKLDYRKHVHKLDSIIMKIQSARNARTRKYYYDYSLLNEKLILQEIRQIKKLSYHRDSVLQYKKEGIMGDIHFSDNHASQYWYTDNLATNAIAYRIVKRDSLLKNLLVPMQMYFLSSREKGGWNTYHSSNVLMSVLPDLLAEGASKEHNAAIKVSGQVNATIDKFPYHLELQPKQELHIYKESGLPLYYMRYVKERVTKAKTGVKGFSVKTSIGNDATILEASKPVALTVEVDIEKEASSEYVMIEIPIPGACSFADKRQNYNGIETHREYFKDRVVIFCENMKTGKYIFVVHLLPRFTGKYLMNPAQISLMYVPVVNANTDMKVVEVK